MAYRPLKTVFHQHDAKTVDHEHRFRLQLPSTLRFAYPVGENDLFVVVTRELATKMEQVWRNELRLAELWIQLPGAARHHYVYSLLIDEIQASNQIENIHSTRHEIGEALEAARRNNGPGIARKRFQEMASAYMALFQSGAPVKLPDTLRDVRELYDSLLGDEIGEDDILDGELFRKSPVSIYDYGSAEPVHRGATDEAEINQRLGTMLQIHDLYDGPELALAFIEHFMLEHTHPFYDGNGRFGRFLLALRLGNLLSTPTALSLSSGIMKEKSAYYAAFINAEHPMNRGEATFFVEAMVQTLLHAQEERLVFLTQKSDELRRLTEVCEAWQDDNPEKLTHYEQQTLFLLGQVHLLGPRSGASWDEIANYQKRSKQTVRPALDSLEGRGLIERLSAKPLVVRLAEAGQTLLGLDS